MSRRRRAGIVRLMAAAAVPLLFAALLAALPAACSQRREAPKPEVLDETLSLKERAELMLDSMTLEQKVGQLFMPALYCRTDSATLRLLDSYLGDFHAGGVLLLQGDTLSAKAISDRIAARAESAGPFLAIDAEWGLAMRLVDAPKFPANGRLPADISDQLLFDYGREMARQSRRLGINMILGPVMDVVGERSPSISILRSFGSDPERVADLATAYARGLESGGVLSVAKHFPGHGATEADSHKTLPRIGKSRAELDSVDLLPFRRYVAGGLGAVMVGHLWMPALDSVERSAAVSPEVMKGLLRGEMGFRGLVVTDAANMSGFGGHSTLDAVLAGADIVIAPQNLREEYSEVLEAARSGKLPMADLNAKVARILQAKISFPAKR